MNKSSYKKFTENMTKGYDFIVQLDKNMIYAQRESLGYIALKLLPPKEDYPTFIYCDKIIISDQTYSKVKELVQNYNKEVDLQEREDINNHIYSLIMWKEQ